MRCSTAPGATIAADAWDAFPSDSVLILKAGAPRSDADMHGDRTRLWVAAETAVKCADHNPRLIDQATKTLKKTRYAAKACLIGSQWPCDPLQCCICRF